MKSILSALALLMAFGSVAQVPSYVPQNGLKCYWPFSGNTNDVSANASHLTNSGAVLTADRNGVPNAAYSFNGSNQSMTRTNPSFTFSSTSSFTISVWISKGSTSGGVAMINGTTAPNNFIWLLQGGATNMTYGTNKQQSNWIYVPAPFTLNIWTHYVCVYNNGTMTFYKDNVVQGTATFPYTGVTSANLPLFIGKGINGGFFNGKMDDIGIWDRALTSCEISDLYTSTSTIVGADAGSDVTVCAGLPVTLTGSGASSLMWDQNVSNGVAFTPLASSTYTLTAMDTTTGCSAWDQVDVTVNTGLVDAGPDVLLCEGSAVTLTATGATGISWDNGVMDGVSFVPTNTQTYTVTGTDGTGCTGADQVLVTLYQPTINAGSNATICAGDSVLLNATGASTYVWSNSATNGAYFIPSSSGTFSVIGTDTAGCANSDSLTIAVDPLSNIQAGADIDVCAGQQVTLSATGGLFYIWNNGVVQNSAFTPQATNTYTVTGADSTNCYNSDSITVTVNQPTTSAITINAIDQYDLNGTVFSSSGTYTQVIQNANGCDSTITLTLVLDFTGIDEVEKLELSWYPNPAFDELNVKIDGVLQGREMKIFGSDGREVKSILLTNESNKIDIKELESGVYTCRIEGEERLMFRWVKK